MIIKFGNFTLGEWTIIGDYHYRRTGTQQYPMVKLQPIIDEYMGYINEYYVHFYSELSCLSSLFPNKIDGDVYFAQEQVDQFLIKMSNLKAFI